MKATLALLILGLAVSVHGQVTYELTLTGDQNSPPSNTDATATIIISFVDSTPDSPTGAVLYNFTFDNVPSPIAGHIHVGAGPGANGSVGVPLFMANYAGSPNAPPVSGLVASNMVVPPTFTGPLEILPDYNNVPVSQLVSQYVTAGQAYVQVHTMENPYGFIRADFNQSAIVEGVVVSPSMIVPVQSY